LAAVSFGARRLDGADDLLRRNIDASLCTPFHKLLHWSRELVAEVIRNDGQIDLRGEFAAGAFSGFAYITVW
jgi:hypothetical protein